MLTPPPAPNSPAMWSATPILPRRKRSLERGGAERPLPGLHRARRALAPHWCPDGRGSQSHHSSSLPLKPHPRGARGAHVPLRPPLHRQQGSRGRCREHGGWAEGLPQSPAPADGCVTLDKLLNLWGLRLLICKMGRVLCAACLSICSFIQQIPIEHLGPSFCALC